MRRRSFVVGLAAMGAGCGMLGNASETETEPEQADEGDKKKKKKSKEPEEEGAKGPGQHWLEAEHDGKTRKSLLYIPESDSDAPKPLLFALHGVKGDANTLFENKNFGDMCAKNGWIGLFPSTGKDHVDRSNALDQEYLASVLEQVIAEENVDSKRVYVVGYSAGAKKAYHLAATHSEQITAIVTHSGRIGHEGDEKLWSPTENGAGKVSVLHIHGKQDPKATIGGGKDKNGKMAVGVMDGLKLWADNNGCEKGGSERPAGAPDSVKVTNWVSGSGHKVVGLVDPDLGHSWADYSNKVLAGFLNSVPPK